VASSTSKHLIVIGASAGGIETLRALVADLPVDFVAPICVVQHSSSESPAILADLLGRAARLPTAFAATGMRLEPGHLYVAPPDYHLLVEPGRLRVTKGPRENRFRPAIDPLFRSAAQVYGPGTIGVVLTGNLDDGTAGLWAIKRLGGIAIVQDPDDALFPGMPRSALAHVRVDHVVPLAQLAPLLTRLVLTPVQQLQAVPASDFIDLDVRIAREENAMDIGIERAMEPSRFTCPECRGVLLQLKEEGRIRFRCHTGHAYSAESLMAAVNDGVETSLATAVRSLEESALLLRQLADHVRTHPNGEADARPLAERAAREHRDAESINRILAARDVIPSGTY
jgi:two-component system chemotaxis response regulator CheB